jgi:dienelactone hydrolase
MSTFPRSICWSNKAARMAGVSAVAFVTVALVSAWPQPAPQNSDKAQGLSPFLEDFQAGKPRMLAPFLDDFFADTEIHVVAKAVRFASAVGPVEAFWARPDHKQALPAALLVYDDDSWAKWMEVNARHLAGIGYEVLTVNVHERRRASNAAAGFTDEATLAQLSAAVRWLRGRSEVLPNRLGVVAWNWSGGQALALASATSLQACVVCDAPLPSEHGLIVGLRGTPMLVVCAKGKRGDLAVFRQRLGAHQVLCKIHAASGVQSGFMGPPDRKSFSHDAAEDAWVAIYSFLEKHVEDARPPAVESLQSTATIADIMRAVNEPGGLRGVLSKALEQEPNGAKQWQRIRANAALMAESGGWLQSQPPPKGPEGHWKEQAQVFRAAAEAIVQAADQRDYAAARRGLQHLAGQCAACHQEHR